VLGRVDQVFILLILIGVTGGSVPLLGIHNQSLIAFAVPTLIPYMIWVAFNLADKLVLVLMILLLYMISIAIAIFRMNENLSYSLGMKYQLEQRTEKLQDANEKLEQLTLLDSLTQLYNRRFFERQLEKEWKKCHRESKRLAMLVIDIDHFKPYNDRYGHAAGDECLKRVASVLSGVLHRPGDIIARIGGEEFVALLPGIDEEGAVTVAESMQAKLREAKIEHDSSPLGNYVTVSIGLAVTHPVETATGLALFKAADKALYRGKYAGRDRIVVGELDMLDG
jgi:diguanylate cyclase (GGDEF)-like protein